MGKGILRLLVNEIDEHLLTPPVEKVGVWGGREIEVATRTGMPAEPVLKLYQKSAGYRPGVAQDYPPAFQSASSMVEHGTVATIETIGERLPLTGRPDTQALGEAMHTFFGADDVKRNKAKRLVMAEKILARWQVAAHLAPESLLFANDRISAWITSKWPEAICHREYPVALRKENGTIVSGFIDQLLETEQGFVIIDHKSFIGNAIEAQQKAASFAGQLGVYSEAVRSALGKAALGCFIHLPVSGKIIQLIA